MPCIPFDFNGARGILCTLTRRQRCACGQAASIQCDGPSRRTSGRGTCDKHLCARCATEIGPDRHLCSTHAQAVQQREPAASGDLFQQQELF